MIPNKLLCMLVAAFIAAAASGCADTGTESTPMETTGTQSVAESASGEESAESEEVGMADKTEEALSESGSSHEASQSASEDHLQTEETNKEPKTEDFFIEDVTVCLSWPKKSVKNIEIPESLAKSGFRAAFSGSGAIEFSGKLFGADAKGEALAAESEEADELVIRQLELTVNKLSYDDAHKALAGLYGAPVDEGIEPEAQSSDGEVVWAVFQNGDIEIWLNKSAGLDYISIQVF